MTHLEKPLQLEANAWTSIYIPIVSKLLAENLVEILEQQLKIGRISSVVFSEQETISGVRVFFSEWYDNRTVRHLRRVISEKGEFNCRGFYTATGYFPESMVFRENKHTDARSSMQQNEKLYEKLYEEVIETNARMTMSMMVREKKIKTLEARLKSFTTVPVPGMEIRLDVGEIIAENHRLKEELERPLTAEEAFKKLRGSIKETKAKWDALLAEHGSHTAIQKSGLLETAYFADLKFDVMGAVKNLYDECIQKESKLVL